MFFTMNEIKYIFVRMNGNNCNELAGIRCLMERTNLIKKIIIMEFTNTNHLNSSQNPLIIKNKDIFIPVGIAMIEVTEV